MNRSIFLFLLCIFTTPSFAQELFFEPQQKLFDAPIQGLFDFPVIALDYNNNGIKEFVARDGDQELVIYADDGVDFVPFDIKSPDIYSRPFEVLDFNQDGFEDIILGSFIHLYDPVSSNYEPFFFTEATSNLPTIVGVADFDGNGFLDLVTVLDSGSKLNNLSIYFNDGTNFEPYEFPYDIDPGSIRIGDLEGDGDMDIAFVDNFNDISPKIIIGDGQGDFVLREVLGYSFLYPRTLDFTDLDNDGDLDFVVINEDNSMKIYQNTDNFISPPFQFTIEQNVSSLASKVADLNNDGFQEIIRLNYNFVGQNLVFSLDIYQSLEPLVFEKVLTLSNFDIPGTFISLNPNYINNTIQITDASSDGDLDIVITFALGTNPSVWLFENVSEIFSSLTNVAHENKTIFPNPSSQTIQLSLANEEHTITSYSIINNLGQTLKSGKYTTTLDISDLQNGHYYLQLTEATGSYTLPFIKVD